FPHSSIYVRTDRGIDAPADLKGKLVGLPNWNFTRGLVVKGMLQDDYGLRQSDIRWRVGPVDAPNDSTYSVRATPPGVHIEDVAAGSHLSAELADGRIDAIIDARAPRAFMDGAPKVGRLFQDFRPVEQEWYRRTGIFPTMHLVAVRIELLERYPSLALGVCNAFQRSKESCRPALSDLDALAVMLPWLVAETEATERLMGNDYWPYGMPRNRRMIEAQTRWSFQQGLTERQLSAADLFAPGTLDWAP
ncbi:MAG: ABC transporter substrate-binding protein, partial [Terriglobia bacterium]